MAEAADLPAWAQALIALVSGGAGVTGLGYAWRRVIKADRRGDEQGAMQDGFTKTLLERVTALEAEVKTLNADLAAANAEAAALRAEVSALRERRDEVKALLKTLEAAYLTITDEADEMRLKLAQLGVPVDTAVHERLAWPSMEPPCGPAAVKGA